MKLFISWSGSPSREIASLLKDWICEVIQEIDAFLSDEDISKGARWGAELTEKLGGTSEGVICVTNSNLRAPWLNFEAGALSKLTESASVRPLLFGITKSDVQGPLSGFQMTSSEDKEDMYKFVQSMNSACESPLLEERLRRAFDRTWPEFSSALSRITPEPTKPTSAKRPMEDLAAETLDIVRQLRRDIAINSAEVEAIINHFRIRQEIQEEVSRTQRPHGDTERNRANAQSREFHNLAERSDLAKKEAYDLLYERAIGRKITLRDGSQGEVIAREGMDTAIVETESGKVVSVPIVELMNAPARRKSQPIRRPKSGTT